MIDDQLGPNINNLLSRLLLALELLGDEPLRDEPRVLVNTALAATRELETLLCCEFARSSNSER